MSTVPLNESASVILNASGNGTVRMRPFGGGETWLPGSASFKATSAVKEAQCRIYIGPAPTDQYFVDSSLSGSTGDSTGRVGGYQVNSHGNYLWAVWTAGDVGATATLQVTGVEVIPGSASPFDLASLPQPSAGCANPIIGGGGALVYPAIISPNFNLSNPLASPSPSWGLLKTGIAYLFGLVITGGTITGPDYIFAPTGLFIYNGAPAVGNLIAAIAPPSTTVDTLGNSVQPGDASASGTIIAIGGTPTGAGNTPSFVQLAPTAPSAVQIGSGDVAETTPAKLTSAIFGAPAANRFIQTVLSAARVSGQDAFRNASITLEGDAVDHSFPTDIRMDVQSSATLFTNITMQDQTITFQGQPSHMAVMDFASKIMVMGYPIVGATAAGGATADTWHVPGLSNGWAAAAAFKYTPVPVTPGGSTWILGNLDPAAVTGGFPSVVFTLSAFYRPTSTMDFAVGEHQGAAGPASLGTFIRITGGTGVVTVINGTVGMGVIVVSALVPLGY